MLPESLPYVVPGQEFAVTVHLNTGVERAARLMLEQHIHRLVVVDEEEEPIGVVTSTDLLRTLLPDEDPARLRI